MKRGHAGMACTGNCKPWATPDRSAVADSGRCGDRVKTDRRDAVSLAQLHGAGELSGVWVPEPAHEAMRDLVRARATAVPAVRRARQHLQGFLVRHRRHYGGPKAWSRAHGCWLAQQRFEHPAQQILFQD
ncbi:MAG: hypothetical protein JO110_16995 [Acetobacteraceae bacterium]|nr:hypothetical protein [Acetobacteraceae bacterium]